MNRAASYWALFPLWHPSSFSWFALRHPSGLATSHVVDAVHPARATDEDDRCVYFASAHRRLPSHRIPADNAVIGSAIVASRHFLISPAVVRDS